jgi:Uma2 family endonuclease
MAVVQRMTEAEYQEFVQSGVEGAWELHDGKLVEKPAVTWRHASIASLLGFFLQSQLDLDEYRVFYEGRVRRPEATVFLPDVFVVPTAFGERCKDLRTLAIISEPLPLVVEVWSESTGDYDVTAKLPVYQQRGDREIWLIHPYERTLMSWQRQPDGSSQQTVYRGGTVTPVALPWVTIDLDRLFAA